MYTVDKPVSVCACRFQPPAICCICVHVPCKNCVLVYPIRFEVVAYLLSLYMRSYVVQFCFMLLFSVFHLLSIDVRKDSGLLQRQAYFY